MPATEPNGQPPFRRVDETEIYTSKIFRLVNVTFEAPDGARFDRQIVRHPGAVAVLPLHDDGTVTLVKQFRGAIEADLIEVPAGILDKPGEDLAQAAARELREEVGLAATELRRLVSYQAAIGFADETITVFVGTGLTFVGKDLQGPEEEVMQELRLPLTEAINMVKRGEITDGKTVMALLLVGL
jgi:8-oxo-dGTP pyrophosphatase MutT (NUDIX family)